MLAVLWLALVSSVAAQSCETIFRASPGFIKLPPGNFPVAVKFERSNLKGVTFTGGVGLTVTNVTILNQPSTYVTSFGDIGAAGNESPACQAKAGSMLSYFILLVATLGFVGMRRVEPMLLVIVGLFLLVQGANSACSATVTVSGSDAIPFDGDVLTRITVTCADGGVPTKVFSGGYSYVECPWNSKFTKAWSAPGNDASCAAAAPATITAESVGLRSGIKFNGMTAVVPSSNESIQVSMSQGVPLQRPTLYTGVVVSAGAAPIDLLLQNVDPIDGHNSKIFPVIVRSGANICKFGYKCLEGSCLATNGFTNLCVEYGFQNPVPAPCLARGNGTGMNCGSNCSSLTCTNMCPDSDCSMARACQTSDNMFPCNYCLCPESCTPTLNEGLRAVPCVFFSLIAAVLLW